MLLDFAKAMHIWPCQYLGSSLQKEFRKYYWQYGCFLQTKMKCESVKNCVFQRKSKIVNNANWQDYRI